MSGVKGIKEMHRFNICLVVVLSLSCSGVKTPLLLNDMVMPYWVHEQMANWLMSEGNISNTVCCI